MYLAHNVQEETLLVHHTLGILLYVLTLYTRSYLYVACLVLMQVRGLEYRNYLLTRS